MFNSLYGRITGKFPQKLFIETNGIEWDVTVPDTALDALPPVGAEARVYVWLQHTDAAMTLFGFASAEDRALFFDLNKVDGVGPRSAIKIMSAVARGQLVAALDSGDLAALEKIPGLGKKTAQKMLLALKGKLSLDEGAPRAGQGVRRGEFADVADALTNMGYDRRQAEDVLSRLAADIAQHDSSFAAKGKEQKEEVLFRRAIVELAQ